MLHVEVGLHYLSILAVFLSFAGQDALADDRLQCLQVAGLHKFIFLHDQDFSDVLGVGQQVGETVIGGDQFNHFARL